MEYKKICTKCKQEKDSSEFYKKSAAKDGLTYQCKECLAKYSHDYQKRNKNIINKQQNEWRAANKEYVRQRNNEYYQRTIDKQKEKDKRYRNSHKDKIAEKGRKYRKEHKEYFNNKKRERKNKLLNNSDGSVTLDGEMYLLKKQNNKCAYCGCELTDSNKQLDHIIPISKGGIHSINNVHWTCDNCNLSKGTKLEEEWFEWLSIHNPEKYEIIKKHLSKRK